jgi:hypothetical protein
MAMIDKYEQLICQNDDCVNDHPKRYREQCAGCGEDLAWTDQDCDKCGDAIKPAVPAYVFTLEHYDMPDEEVVYCLECSIEHIKETEPEVENQEDALGVLNAIS